MSFKIHILVVDFERFNLARDVGRLTTQLVIRMLQASWFRVCGKFPGKVWNFTGNGVLRQMHFMMNAASSYLTGLLKAVLCCLWTKVLLDFGKR